MCVTDYISNGNCEFSYRLKGYSDGYKSNGKSSRLTFTGLNPGKYELFVRYTNGEKLWSNDIHAISFIISPPIWKSKVAICLYIILTISCIISGYCLIRRNIKKAQTEQAKRIHDREKDLINNAKLDFFTNLANELIMPLSLIYGPSIKLEDYEKSDSIVRKYAATIHTNAKRMTSLLSELKDFYNANSENGIVLEYFNVAELIDKTIESFSEIIEAKHIDMLADINGGTPLMFVSDRHSIEKIIFSLISYACTNSPDSEKIILNCHIQSSGNLIFSINTMVHDMNPENLSYIFDKYNVLDNFGNKEDNHEYQNCTGISISKSLANKLGGDIIASLSDNSHIYLTFSLPPKEATAKLIQQYEFRQQTSLMTENKEAAQDVLQGKHILTAGENQDLQILIKESLQPEQNQIFEARNLNDGMNILQNHRIDMVIIESFIEGSSGINMIKAIRKDKLLQHIPILFISRDIDEYYKNLVLKAGVDGIISMPFNPNHLYNIVCSIFSQREAMKRYSNSAISNMEIHNGSLVHHEDVIFLDLFTSKVEASLDSENISIDNICSELNISKITLYRKIRQISGMTVTDYVRSIKMKKASILLKETKMSVKEIMYKSGYNHKSLFYKHFEEYFKMTPKQYRETFYTETASI